MTQESPIHKSPDYFPTTWRAEIIHEMSKHGETWADLESCTLSENQLDVAFDANHGTEEGAPFTAWTRNRTYFPVCYDGAEWVASVARNPDGKPTPHVGGG